MAGAAGSGSRACGHPVQPGSGFCPVCGRPATGGAAPSQPATAPLPVVPASPQATLPPVSPTGAPLPQPESSPWDSWYAPRQPPPPPPGPQPWHSRRPLVPVIVAAAFVAVVAGVVIFRAHPGSAAATGTTGTAPSASSQDARRQ